MLETNKNFERELRVMGRIRSCGFLRFSHIQMIGYVRLGYSRVKDAPQGVKIGKLPSGARNVKKATVKVQKKIRDSIINAQTDQTTRSFYIVSITLYYVFFAL